MRACPPLERKRVGSERGDRYDLRSGSTLIGHHAVKLAHDLNGYRFVSPFLAPHDYTALPEHEIETEVDRYIAWPGQALSYYMGELAIVRAREKAEKTLGANIQHPRFPRCRARARLGTAARCHGAGRPLHHRRRQRPLPGYGVTNSLLDLSCDSLLGCHVCSLRRRLHHRRLALALSQGSVECNRSRVFGIL